MISMDFYFVSNTLEFLYISIFCQTHIDFYGFYQLFLLYGIFGLLLSAQRVWILALWRMGMHFYGNFFVPNMYDLYVFILFSNNALMLKKYGFLFWARTCMDFYGLLMSSINAFPILHWARNYVEHGWKLQLLWPFHWTKFCHWRSKRYLFAGPLSPCWGNQILF